MGKGKSSEPVGARLPAVPSPGSLRTGVGVPPSRFADGDTRGQRAAAVCGAKINHNTCKKPNGGLGGVFPKVVYRVCFLRSLVGRSFGTALPPHQANMTSFFIVSTQSDLFFYALMRICFSP